MDPHFGQGESYIHLDGRQAVSAVGSLRIAHKAFMLHEPQSQNCQAEPQKLKNLKLTPFPQTKVEDQALDDVVAHASRRETLYSPKNGVEGNIWSLVSGSLLGSLLLRIFAGSNSGFHEPWASMNPG